MRIAITKSCDDFLIEVVSRLCFGQQAAPEDELIQLLFNLIFTETEEEGEASKMTTGELTLNKRKKDEIPVIRSFLLQLLLGHKSVQYSEKIIL